MRDADLERALGDLAAHLEPPPTVDLVPRVRARLVADPVTATVVTPGFGRPTGWARLAVAGLAIVVVAGTVLVASPGTRRAVADWFGLRGVEIESREELPATLGTELDVGARVPLAEAETQAGFAVLLPPVDRFGEPDAVFVAPAPSGARVTLLYRATEQLPATDATGVGLLLTQFVADPDRAALRKSIAAGGSIEETTVDGEPGYWFEGEPHGVTFTDEHGELLEDSSRLAGNTLVWEHGDLTLRIESALTRAETVRIAESLG
jgi:hypothetical protein